MSSAFGTQVAKVNNKDVYSSKEAGNFYALTSQQDYQVERTLKIAEAMADPANYYKQRASALENVREQTKKHFGEQYATLINLKIPHAEAVTRATVLADAVRTVLLAGVANDLPADINALSLQLVSNKARAPGGFVQPNAAVPTGRGGGRKRK